MPANAPPDAPTGPFAAVTGREVRLDWRAPTTGEPVDNYVIEAVREADTTPGTPPGVNPARIIMVRKSSSETWNVMS